MPAENRVDSLDRQLASYRRSASRRALASADPQSGADWKLFAAAAGATLAGATAADAAIQHVVPPTPISVPIPTFYYTYSTAVDLDNDAVDDLSLVALVRTTQFFYGYHYSGFADGINGNQMIGAGGGNLRRFAAGEVIPAVAPAVVGSLIHRSLTSLGNLFSTGGLWELDDSAFAGFVKGPAGAKQAGWVKIRTDAGLNGRLDSITLLEWAYQTVPGVSIMAGATEEAGIDGDYNNDGQVDAGDYVRWRNNLGDPTEADINNNGNGGGVTISDYSYWKARYGNPGSGSGGLTSSVPEPGTVTLGVLALGAAGIAALRRRTI